MVKSKPVPIPAPQPEAVPVEIIRTIAEVKRRYLESLGVNPSRLRRRGTTAGAVPATTVSPPPGG